MTFAINVWLMLPTVSLAPITARRAGRKMLSR
jgi:hypothetical protein